MTTATPVLDTIVDINAASIEHTQLSARELMLARLAAMVAIDAPPASYLANARPGAGSGISQQDVQDIMIAVAPLVGTAKVVSAGGNIMRALDLAITVAEQDAGSLSPQEGLDTRCFRVWHRRN